jgi:hypothetical protein
VVAGVGYFGRVQQGTGAKNRRMNETAVGCVRMMGECALDRQSDGHARVRVARRTGRAQAKERRQRSGQGRSHDGVLVGQAWRLTPGKIGQFAGIKRRKGLPCESESSSSSVAGCLPSLFLLFVTSSTTHLAPSPFRHPFEERPLQQGNLLFPLTKTPGHAFAFGAIRSP